MFHLTRPILINFPMKSFYFNDFYLNYYICYFIYFLILRYFSKLKNADLLERVPKYFLLSAGVYFILQLIGCCLLFEKKDSQTAETDIEQKKNEENEELTQHLNDPVNKNTSEINSLGVWLV